MAAPLVHQVNVKSTPETIYKAVSTAQGLAAFWTSESKAEPKVGSIASFGFGGPTQRMRVDELVPGKRVKWTGLADFPNWGDTTVSWDISPAENGESSVTFRNSAFPGTASQEPLGASNHLWDMISTRRIQSWDAV